MTLKELAVRVTTLERKIASLSKNEAFLTPANINGWIDPIQGTFANDAGYRQAARFGREWRQVSRGTIAKAQEGMIVLDTDIFSLLELPASPEVARPRHRKL